MRLPVALLALLAALSLQAQALDLSDDVTISGYGDLRAVAAANPSSVLDGGLGKFRFGNGATRVRFAEAVLQGEWRVTGDLSAVTLLRAEPNDRNVVDVLETYIRYAPRSGGDISWSVKAGAFFPTISLENDDLGWTSPYTLTPSAINSWIGDELRTIGSEAIVDWKTQLGTWSLTAAITCCNDEAGTLMADRGWVLEDRPTGLFERIRIPAQTLKLFFAPPNLTSGMFDEIDGRPGWYAGLGWDLDGTKISVLRYDNQGDPYAFTARDAAWDTRFWSATARTRLLGLQWIAQAMRGDTIVAGPGFVSHTKFQSAFLLASYDLDDVRLSAREEVFATRKVAAASNIWSEDGDAFTAAAIWSVRPWLTLTGEVIALHARRGEYVPAGLGLERNDTQVQFSTRFFF